MYNRESKIMRKLLGKASSDTTPGDLSVTTPPNPISSLYRPPRSQNAAHSLAVPASCLDVTADRRSVVFAGPHILKTAVLDSPEGSNFSVNDAIDIRSAITSQKTSGSRANLVSDQLNIRDVKWHGTSTIFTACASGRIFAYDLSRVGAAGSDPFEYIQTQEDSRQVNSLDVNPHLKTWLLSGSQDGIARVFDISQPHPSRSGVLSFRQRFSPLKSNDPIREVAWSPTVGQEMACCTEAGVVLKWDVRNASRPLLRINAHEKACTTIAWHPDGTHLMSAGWDAKLQVWDLGNTADKRQKPKYTLTTPAPVSTLAWRPSLWSNTTQSRRAAQVAVSYDETSSRRYGSSVVQLWDLARPTMPYKEVERFDTSPSALLWRDQDLLWTVGQDGLFTQCDMVFAPKTIDRRSTSAMAFSPRGDAMMFLEERIQQSRPRMMLRQADIDPITPYSTSPRTPTLSMSKSDSEDDVLNSFLGPRRRLGHRRRLSNRGTSQSQPSTPIDDSNRALSLEQSINVTGTFKTTQSMAWGPIPTVKSVSVFQYMSAHYLDILANEVPKLDDETTLAQRVGTILERFALVAEAASFFRVSQVWRIIAFAMDILLNKRAEFHLHARLSHFQKLEMESNKISNKFKTPSIQLPTNGDDLGRKPSSQAGSIDGRIHNVRSLLSEEIESTSNVPTPLARPVDGSDVAHFDNRQYQHGQKLTAILEPESLTLGPAAHKQFSESPRTNFSSSATETIGGGSQESHESITEGYDFYDTEALARAIDVPSRHSDKVPRRAKAIRQDSEESFSQIFSISDGTKKASQILSETSTTERSRKESQSEAGSSESNDQYPSRIRGEQLDEEDDQNGTVRRKKRDSRTKPDSPQDVFMISQTTASGDGTYPSQQSFISQSDSDQLQSFRTSTVATEARSQRADSFVRAEFEHDPRPHIIETDYLPWPNDPDFDILKSDMPLPSTLNPYLIIQNALTFETRTSTLNASAMALLLGPLVPDSVIDLHQTRAILKQHHSRLMGLSLFVEAALLRKLCVKGWPDGLPDWGENYPGIFSQAQQHVKNALFCSSCRKPRESEHDSGDAAVWTCERCQAIMDPCAVCKQRDPELASCIPEIADQDDFDPESWLSGWWYCPGCGHGGHASCLHIWHGEMEQDASATSSEKFSDGCCPLDGCGHACLPGKYRDETTTARSGEVGRVAADSYKPRSSPQQPQQQQRRSNGKRRGSPEAWRPLPERSVKNDTNEVPQSKAVGIAREALNKSAGSSFSGQAISGGILSSSPGRIPGTGERERRKSVKFAKSD